MATQTEARRKIVLNELADEKIAEHDREDAERKARTAAEAATAARWLELTAERAALAKKRISEMKRLQDVAEALGDAIQLQLDLAMAEIKIATQLGASSLALHPESVRRRLSGHLSNVLRRVSDSWSRFGDLELAASKAVADWAKNEETQTNGSEK